MASCATPPLARAPAAVEKDPTSWYRAKMPVRRSAPTIWLSEACSTARNGPTSLPLGLMTPKGKSWLEALRCLKRHLAEDVVLRTMLADLERSAKPAAMGACRHRSSRSARRDRASVLG